MEVSMKLKNMKKVMKLNNSKNEDLKLKNKNLRFLKNKNKNFILMIFHFKFLNKNIKKNNF